MTLAEHREATPQEIEFLDSRRRSLPAERKQSPYQEIADTVAESLLRGASYTFVYINDPDCYNSWREAELMLTALRNRLGRNYLRIRAAMDDSVSGQTTLVIGNADGQDL